MSYSEKLADAQPTPNSIDGTNIKFDPCDIMMVGRELKLRLFEMDNFVSTLLVECGMED